MAKKLQPAPLDKMTKPELVKALKAAQKRIAKLETQRTKLLECVARLERTRNFQVDLLQSAPTARTTYVLDPAGIGELPAFPWETK